MKSTSGGQGCHAGNDLLHQVSAYGTDNEPAQYVPPSGTDVMILEIFSQKKIAKNWRF
jgi:hypothetical protein